MNPDQETQKLIDEWLKKGNKIKRCAPAKRTDPDDIQYLHKWGKGKKKKSSKKG